MNEELNSDLPFFAYGLFKPGEVAHKQIKSYLDPYREHFQDRVCGCLYVRDGLPLLKEIEPASQEFAKGYLLYFKDKKEAYKCIKEFEPEDHYRWGIIETLDSGEKANVLIGKNPDRGGILLEHCDEWFGNLDPIFNEGITSVRKVIDEFAQQEFESIPLRILIGIAYFIFKWHTYFFGP